MAQSSTFFNLSLCAAYFSEQINIFCYIHSQDTNSSEKYPLHLTTSTSTHVKNSCSCEEKEGEFFPEISVTVSAPEEGSVRPALRSGLPPRLNGALLILMAWDKYSSRFGGLGRKLHLSIQVADKVSFRYAL